MSEPVSFEKYLSQELKDPEFKAEWDALEPEFQIVRAIIEGRAAQHFNVEQLSRATGIAESDIESLEDGTANPTLSMLKNLANGLGMTLRLDFRPRV